MIPFKLLLRQFFVLGLLFPSSALFAQDLSNVGKQKPFAISGSIGGSTTFYSSNEIYQTQPPFTWNLYGNLTPSIYGLALPISFVVNQYGNSYTSPFAQFGMSPTYKWARLLLGYRSISMSPFTFDGQTFEGVGIELNPGILRFAAFYGSLNKAINEDTTTAHLAMPQYGRIGYGVKLGVGTASNHIDFLYFHAKDDSSSVKLINDTLTLRPQENTVVGSSFKFTFLKHLIWTGDVAVSALTQDQGSSPLNTDSLNVIVKTFAKAMDYRYSTVLGYAGQSTLTFLIKNFNTTFGYRTVSSGFQSLGTPYMISDLVALQWNGNLMLDKGKVNLTATINTQHDDLGGDQESETHNVTGVFNMNALLSSHVNLNINFSDVNLNQTNGTAEIGDSILLDQDIYTISAMPTFIFKGTGNIQTLSPSVNYSMVHDLNPATAPTNDSKTFSGNLNYVCSFIHASWSLNASLLYNQYVLGSSDDYTSYGANLGAALQLLKSKGLGLQGSIGYLINQSSEASVGDNITGSINVHYTYRKKHSFSLYFNSVVTPPTSSQLKNTVGVTTNNTGGGISYNYSF
jgi:hypothetical protein